MKFNDTLLMIVLRDIQSGSIPMLLGEPGIGKSSWVETLAKLCNTEVFVLPCNQLADKADLTGARLVPIEGTNEYKQVFYPHSVIMDAIMYAEAHKDEYPILFLDELNRTTPDVTSECLSIPTLRKIGDKRLPDNLRVITAGNDKGNITALDEASISRFVLYRVTPDLDTFITVNPGLNPFIHNVLMLHPETIFCKKIKIVSGTTQNNAANDDDDDYDVDINSIIDDAEEMAQIATPRTISSLSRWLNAFSNDELTSMLVDTSVVDGETVSVLQEAIEGHTGKTAFSSFLLAEIADKIQTIANQANNVAMMKPVAYDKLTKCTDMTALEECVNHMTQKEKSACLVYAIYEHKDNAPYINMLANSLTQLEQDDLKMLMNLYANNTLFAPNLKTFISGNTAIGNTYALVFNAN